MIDVTNPKLLPDTIPSIYLGDVGVEFTVDEDPVHRRATMVVTSGTNSRRRMITLEPTW